MTKEEKNENLKRAKELQKELISLLLKKAGLKEKNVTDIALKRWATNNLDLLDQQELEKYKSIILCQ